MDLIDSQQWHGYGYANNNPITFSDAHGLCVYRDDDLCISAGSDRGKVVSSGHDITRGDDKYRAYHHGPMELAPGIYISEKFSVEVQQDIYDEFWEVYENGYCTNDYCEPISENQVKHMMYFICMDVDECSPRDMMSFPEVLENAVMEGFLSFGFAPVPMAIKGGPKGSRGGGGSCLNSFSPDTKVLLADGRTAPIKDIKPGDQVLATDPTTGDTAAKTVLTTIIGNGTKNLVGITIDTDGDTGHAADTIIATDGHPFWVSDLSEWVMANHLRAGQWLQTSAGTWIQITAVHRWTQTGTVYNLTVDDIHTYYVLAGKTPVLVHNTGPGAGGACGVPVPTQKAGPTLRLTNAQATDLANYLGFRPTNYIVRGQRVFTDGRSYIVQDTTSHNGGTWKIANSVEDLNSKTTRTATTDALLNEIGG
jgi:hypothetical protein